jgi:hypothetical protein
MRLPPGLYPPHLIGSPVGILVLGLAPPTALGGAMASLATGDHRTILLAVAGAIVRVV